MLIEALINGLKVDFIDDDYLPPIGNKHLSAGWTRSRTPYDGAGCHIWLLGAKARGNRSADLGRRSHGGEGTTSPPQIRKDGRVGSKKIGRGMIDTASSLLELERAPTRLSQHSPHQRVRLSTR